MNTSTGKLILAVSIFTVAATSLAASAKTQADKIYGTYRVHSVTHCQITSANVDGSSPFVTTLLPNGLPRVSSTNAIWEVINTSSKTVVINPVLGTMKTTNQVTSTQRLQAAVNAVAIGKTHRQATTTFIVDKATDTLLTTSHIETYTNGNDDNVSTNSGGTRFESLDGGDTFRPITTDDIVITKQVVTPIVGTASTFYILCGGGSFDAKRISTSYK